MSAENTRQFASPIVAWILTGAGAAASVLALGCGLALVDRTLATRQAHRHLVNQGFEAKQLNRLAALTFAFPYASVAAIGLAFGIVICANIVSPGFAMPWTVIEVAAAAVLAIGVLGTLAVASLASRGALRERE